MDRNSKEFKKLQTSWYKRLEKSGFKDIERNDGTDRVKTDHDSYFREKYALSDFKASERYYQLAGQLLHDYPFMNGTEKEVWRLHTQGKESTHIAKRLKIDRHRVGWIIDRVGKWIRVE